MKKKFTLTELLIVLPIVAVFICVLIPALDGAQQDAKTTLCIANLRKIAQASQSYGNAYDDWIPPGCDFRSFHRNRSNVSWYQRIMEFSNDDPSILVCPGATQGYGAVAVKGSVRYVPNATRLDYSAIVEISGIWANGERYYLPHKFSEAADPRLTVLNLDGPAAIMIPRSTACSERAAGQRFDQIFRHENSANIAFLDGHVASEVRPEENELQDKYHWQIKTNCPPGCSKHWHP